jgi:exopolysaccharide production protein ExoZ
MWFYTAFALVLAFRPGLWGRVAAMAAVFVAVYFAGKAAGREGPISIFLGYTITFEFVMGMAIYAMVRSRGKLRLPSALLLTVAGAALFCWAIARGDPGYDDRFIFWGIPAAALVYASLSFPEMKGSAGRLLELLGDASYSIYLSHMLTIGALYTLSRRLLPLQPPAFIALAFIASLAVGVASYLMIEKPLLQAARGGIRQARQRPT